MLLNLDALAPPLVLRPSVTLSDEELMRFSEDNRPYKIERNNRGEITIMTPVGGDGGAHEVDVSGELLFWNRTARTGRVFTSNAGSTFPTAPDSHPMPPGWI